MSLNCVAAGYFSLLILFVFTGSAFGEDWDSFYKRVKVEARNRDKLKFAAFLNEFSGQDHLKGAQYLWGVMKKSTNPSFLKLRARDVLMKFSSEEVGKFVLSEVKRNRDNPLMAQILASIKPEGIWEAFYRNLKSTRSFEAQSVIIRALADKKEHPKDIIKLILQMTGDRYRQGVRKGAVTTLGSIKYKESVPVIASLMNDPLLRDYCIDSLQRLTGQEIGFDEKGWLAWYEKNKEFEPVNAATSTYMDNLYKKPSKDDPYYAEFYDIPIEGKNILFIIDRSGSMSAPSTDGTRMETLKKEFKEMIDMLGYERSIALNFFPGRPYRNGVLNKLTPDKKEDIKKYITKVGPGGSTPLLGAMDYSFKKLIPKNDIDTIYLLTDGQPNSPEDMVRNAIQGLNTTHYIKIHTISIGSDSKFLQNVANDNNGKYTMIQK